MEENEVINGNTLDKRKRVDQSGEAEISEKKCRISENDNEVKRSVSSVGKNQITEESADFEITAAEKEAEKLSANGKESTKKSQDSRFDVDDLEQVSVESKRNKSKNRFRYGNYNQYYGKRLEIKFQRDPRMALLEEKWFYNKTVLDVGCNAGVVSILVAKEFKPRRVLGIDIDSELVGTARKNIRHYCDWSVKFAGKLPDPLATTSSDTGDVAMSSDEPASQFPNNVWFIQGNYVLESDELLEMVVEEYNVILALSITKWIHLNWGDAGIKRFFQRIYKQLYPNGKLILETQDIRTYGKRARAGSEEMKAHYKAIKLRPEQFHDYLLTTVGFREAVDLGVATGSSKGFSRPLVMYIK